MRINRLKPENNETSYRSADLTPLAAHHTFICYDQRGSGFSSFVGDTAKLPIRKHLEDIEIIRRHFNRDKLNG